MPRSTQGLQVSNTEITDENMKPAKESLLKDLGIDNSSSALRKELRANGLYLPAELNYNSSFYRVKRIDPYYMVEGGIEYLFFTKPDLNLIDSDGTLTKKRFADTGTDGLKAADIEGGANAIPYFRDLMNNGYKRTFSDLCYSHSTELGFDKCPFVRILSNRKTSNMDVPDITTQELETSRNMYGTKLYYPTSSMTSDENFEFNIEFEDTQYLEVYHFFKAYDMYRQMKWLGIVAPDIKYVTNKILHDHMSVYKFIVDVDGETLLYWAKATGVYPKTISRSSFNEFQDKGGLKINVQFKVSGWFEDMDPNILTDYNELIRNWINGRDSGSLETKESEIYDTDLDRISGESLAYFYIEKMPHSAMKVLDGSTNTSAYGRYFLKGGKW